MKAWLITRGPGLLAALTKGEGEIVDILSARNSCEDVRQYVQRLYDRCCLTLWERAEGARYNASDPIYKAEVNFHTLPNAGNVGVVMRLDRSRSPQIHCGNEGHGPCFAAQLVKNLVVEPDDETGQERVIWEPWTP
jgi:hypothetical protein